MTIDDEREAMDAVSSALARKTGANTAEYQVSNGIVLAYRPVPPALTNALRMELDARLPRVPVVWIEDKGRNEENPNDPDYIAALAKAERLNQLAIDDMLCAAGTEVVSVPEGCFQPDDDGWTQTPAIKAAIRAGLPLDLDDPQKRFVAYVRYYCLATFIDAMVHSQLSVAVQGIREEDVDAAMAAFRGIPERDADSGAPAQDGVDGANGNPANRAARRSRARDRSA